MPGTDLNITLPVVGTDSWPVWADRVTTALTTIINDIEAQVVTSEILENADHDFNGFALTDARWVVFRSGNTSSLPTYGLGFKNGDLWACDGGGNQVQISSSGQLAGIGNGFRGDTAYAKYTASSSLYEFLDSSNAYDNVKAAQFLVANGTTADATISYAGSVGTNFKLPTTAASGVSVVSIDSSGQLAHNATITTGPTLNNCNVTFTGTGKIAHPTRHRSVIVPQAASSLPRADVASGTTTVFPIVLNELERVVTGVFRMTAGGVGNTRLRIQKGIDGAFTALTLSTASTFLDVAPGAVSTQTLTLQTPYTWTTNETLYLTVEGPATSGTTNIWNLQAGIDSV